MHDTVDLEARGLPGVFIATEQFVEGADVQSNSLGAETAGIYVEHPIQDRTDDEMIAIADRVFGEIVAALVAG
ncbi:MAG: hypothetical protein GY725_11470 [bacterium]|nr:hypothetical protein [bacterium]